MISSTDEYLFSRAFNLAMNGEHRVRVGCLAAVKGRTLCGAWNTIRNVTTSGVKFTNATRHAEWNCLNMIPYEARKASTIYVARVDQDGLLKPSKPCKRCWQIINVMGIKEVVFWTKEETLTKVKVLG